MIRNLLNFFRGKAGASALEYAFIAGLVSIAIVAALTNLGSSLDTIFTSINSSLEAALS